MPEIPDDEYPVDSQEAQNGNGNGFDPESPISSSINAEDYPDPENQLTAQQINRVTLVFKDAELMEEAFKSDGVVRCMDGGTEGGLRMAGSGILLPRKKLAFPNLPHYKFLQKYGVKPEGAAETAFELEGVYSERLKKLVDQGVVKGISAHEECGAAKGDFERVLRASGIKDDDTIGEILTQTPQFVIDEHARAFSRTLAQVLGVPDPYIPMKEMSREAHGHKEEAFYIDLIGGTRPGVAFDSGKCPGLPNGFTIHPALSDWKQVFDRLKISMGIAKVDQHFSKEKPFLVVLIVDPKQPGAVTPEIISGIHKATEKYKDRIVIRQVAPNM
jgi:DNA-binding Lrp family transcriptional regulator